MLAIINHNSLPCNFDNYILKTLRLISIAVGYFYSTKYNDQVFMTGTIADFNVCKKNCLYEYFVFINLYF